MARQCFVISPIGDPGSPTREHADDVFDFIIKPAMDELGMVAYRADHNRQIGRITDQMIDSIMKEDFCIAILTDHNPNVFYELAIAQSAARPVIILIERGQKIPFDVRDLRTIEYDLRPRPLRDKVYSQRIVENVRTLEATNWEASVPFGNHLAPLGNGRGHLKVYDKMERYGPSDGFLDMIRNASTRLDLAGVSLRWWSKIASLRSVFLEKAEQGCQIRVLIMHPDNPALPEYLNNSLGIGGFQQTTSKIEATFAFFAQLSAIQPNIQVCQVRIGCLHQQMVMNDEKMLLTLLLYSEETARSPLFEVSSPSPLYQTMSREFESLWNTNSLSDRSGQQGATTGSPGSAEGNGQGTHPTSGPAIVG
jgi:hypothetical protein